VNIWNICWICKSCRTFLIDEIKRVLDFLPLPVMIARCFLVSNFEQTCILKIHQSYHFLITIVHDKCSSETVKISFGTSTLRCAEKNHVSQDSHFIILLAYLCKQCCSCTLKISLILYNTSTLKLVRCKVVHVLLWLCHKWCHINMTCSNFFCLHNIHVL